MKEPVYYGPIRSYLQEALGASFAKEGLVVVDFEVNGGTQRMSTAIRNIVRRFVKAGIPEQRLSELLEHSRFLKELTVDLTGVALLRKEPHQYRLIVGEVKAQRRLVLKHLSQLLGYQFASGANYGLLIGVDSAPSEDFDLVLRYNPTLLDEVHGTKEPSRWRHQIAICRWDSMGNQLIFYQRSKIQSIDMLARAIGNDLLGN